MKREKTEKIECEKREREREQELSYTNMAKKARQLKIYI